MSARRMLTLALALVGAAAVFHLAGCSSGKGPTYPGGGGGGGGGTTFTFTFPAVGSSSSQTFTTAGSYPYACIAHGSSGMTGTVTVDASSANDSALVYVGVTTPNGTTAANMFAPAAVTIRPNGHVRWIRNAPGSAANHSANR